MVTDVIKNKIPIDEFVKNLGPEFRKRIFPDTYLVTMELPAPKSATLSEAVILIENKIPGSKVVHIEKLEKLS